MWFELMTWKHTKDLSQSNKHPIFISEDYVSVSYIIVITFKAKAVIFGFFLFFYFVKISSKVLSIVQNERNNIWSSSTVLLSLLL